MTNPYEVLGVSESASAEEIKSAYRKKAKECHPDLHPDDPHAQDRMNEVNEAYDILSNPEKLAMWKAQQSSPYQTQGYGTYENPYGSYGQTYYGQNPYNTSQGNGGIKFTFFGPFGYYSSGSGFNSYFGGRNNTSQNSNQNSQNQYNQSNQRPTSSPVGRVAKALIRMFIFVTAMRFIGRLIYFLLGGFLFFR